jgi:diguanylate cyclase (GGDEF)-like protein
MTTTLMTLTEKTNRSAAAEEMARLEMAVESELLQAQHQAAVVASGESGRFTLRGDDAHNGSLAERLHAAWHVFGFDSLYALDESGSVVLGLEMGQPIGDAGFSMVKPMIIHLIRTVEANRRRAQEAGAYDLSSPGFEKSHGASALLHDGTGLTLASVVPIKALTYGSGGSVTLVTLRAVPDSALRDIGRRYGLGKLTFTTSGSAASPFSVAISDASGSRIGTITWEFSRPGSAMLPNLLLIVMTGLLAVIGAFAVLFDRLRKLGAEMTREEEKANRLASHDHLSGLLNRRSFNERITAEMDRTRRMHSGFALHIVDLDRFKEVNDTLGHQAGDAVIREAARRIQDTVRGADIVARLGGDEFAIVQVDTETTHEAGALAVRLREAINQPIRIGGAEITLGCSIGIVLAPQEDHDVDGVISLADSALYQAKNDGRNRYRFFEESIDAHLKMKQFVEEELRDAIAQNQLELHYQPQVSADGLTIRGVEALVRWRHPVRGLILPLEFISIAEERGLMLPLSQWVLRRACEDGKRWGNIKVAVNVSAAQFKQPNFVRDLLVSVDDIGFDLSRLELELTEGMIVEDEEKAEQAIFALREHGISLALDDFGTGYSSLIYLRRFPFDKIKIDRAFLESMETTGESAILVHSVVHLGRALGLTVCAEGIETEEQHRFLQAVGCHELQGYLFSKPVTSDRIDEMLASGAPFARVA